MVKRRFVITDCISDKIKKKHNFNKYFCCVMFGYVCVYRNHSIGLCDFFFIFLFDFLNAIVNFLQLRNGFSLYFRHCEFRSAIVWCLDANGILCFNCILTWTEIDGKNYKKVTKTETKNFLIKIDRYATTSTSTKIFISFAQALLVEFINVVACRCRRRHRPTDWAWILFLIAKSDYCLRQFQPK